MFMRKYPNDLYSTNFHLHRVGYIEYILYDVYVRGRKLGTIRIIEEESKTTVREYVYVYEHMKSFRKLLELIKKFIREYFDFFDVEQSENEKYKIAIRKKGSIVMYADEYFYLYNAKDGNPIEVPSELFFVFWQKVGHAGLYHLLKGVPKAKKIPYTRCRKRI